MTSTHESMIDRVAGAIYDSEEYGAAGAEWDRIDARICRAYARAAIAALREPTIEMCDAATRATSAFLALEQRGVDLRRLKHSIRWRAMIDHILSEQGRA